MQRFSHRVTSKAEQMNLPHADHFFFFVLPFTITECIKAQEIELFLVVVVAAAAAAAAIIYKRSRRRDHHQLIGAATIHESPARQFYTCGREIINSATVENSELLTTTTTTATSRS